MEDERSPGEEKAKKTERKHSVRTYVRWAMIYAVILLLVLLAINYDAFSRTAGRIFGVLMPLLYGLLIAYLCNPLFTLFLEKIFVKISSISWRKTLSLICTYVLVILLLCAILLIVIQQTIISVQEFVNNLPSYISQTEKAIVDFINDLPFLKSESELEGYGSTFRGSDTTADTGTETDPADGVTGSEDAETNAPDSGNDDRPPLVTDENGDSIYDDTVSIFDFSLTKEGIIKLVREFFSDSAALLKTVGDTVISSGTAAVTTVVNILLGFILSVYILADKDKLMARCKKLTVAMLGDKKSKRVFAVANYSNDTIGRFIKGKLVESLLFGTMSYLLFLIFKIPNSLMIAVLVAIMNLVPIFGPFLGAIPAGFLVLLSGDLRATLTFVIIIVILTQINGNYISPHITGNSTGLTAFGSIAALLLMSGYFGVIGMFVGIPICAVVIKLVGGEMNRKLEAAGLSQDLDDYYSPEALERLREYRKQNRNRHPHNIVGITVDGVKALWHKLFSKKK